MKKILTILLAIMMLFTVTACGAKDMSNEPSGNNNETPQKEETNKKEENKQEEETSVYDDEIIDYDEEDNYPYEEEKVVVEKIINCDGCVFAYFSDEGDKAKTLGSTLSPSEYTTDVTTLKTGGRKQRHNFFGLVLSGNTIAKAYACILKDNKVYCIQGSTDGAYHTNNIGILNQIFSSGQCKTISAGHTYTCTDGDYNGDTITTGYASLHYETSCVIYGSEGGNAGRLICH